MSLRNIDFEALRSLRDRHGAPFPRGKVICREGETTSEFYVVLQGAVEVSVRDATTGEKRVLFTIPAGGFFGEMSCFSGQPRSATCIASEDSVLLFFNQETAIQLLRASPRFALGVIQTMCDRLRTANERIGRLEVALTAAGLPLPASPPPPPPPPATPPAASPAPAARTVPGPVAAQAAMAAATARPVGADLPPPEYNRALLWGKPCQCPVSGTRFTALNVRPDVAKVKQRDTDFREVYDGLNPLWYLVYVCPQCLYAAYPDDFEKVGPEERAALLNGFAARREIVAGLDMNTERGPEQAAAAYWLAIESYAARPANHQRAAGLYQRLAWLAREAKDATAERGYLDEALQAYKRALASEKPADPTAELMLLYTIGEISLRLGNPVEAVKYLAQASQHPEFRKQPEIQRLCRDRWTEARAMARPRA